MFLIALVPIVICLLINYFVAKKFEAIAFQKGYDSSISSFAMCFWLGIIGYLYVIALPNLNSGNTKAPIAKGNNNHISLNISAEDEYDKLVKMAERYKDTFFDRDLRIRMFESIVSKMEVLASQNFKDSAQKLEEYRYHLELLKSKRTP